MISPAGLAAAAAAALLAVSPVQAAASGAVIVVSVCTDHGARKGLVYVPGEGGDRSPSACHTAGHCVPCREPRERGNARKS